MPGYCVILKQLFVQLLTDIYRINVYFDRMDINRIIDSIHPLPDRTRLVLTGIISEITYPKGYLLLKADKVEPNIYFLKRGIVRAYADGTDHEITFWFGKEGDPVISMKSYVADERGYEYVELLEQCDLYEIKTRQLRELFQEDIYVANWGRKLAERELVKTEERLISRQFKTASERYSELISHHPHLLQRVQLSYIASYLGITQASLSRIRAEIR